MKIKHGDHLLEPVHSFNNVIIWFECEKCHTEFIEDKKRKFIPVYNDLKGMKCSELMVKWVMDK